MYKGVFNKDQVDEIMQLHSAWLKNEKGGVRAVFGDGCSFNRTNDGWLEFKERCEFGENCKFPGFVKLGNDCDFGDNCNFGNMIYFGAKSSFGRGCTFNGNGRFGFMCSFKSGCIFGYSQMFDDRCSFGRGCTMVNGCFFGDNCTFDQCKWNGIICDNIYVISNVIKDIPQILIATNGYEIKIQYGEAGLESTGTFKQIASIVKPKDMLSYKTLIGGFCKGLAELNKITKE